MRLEKNIKTSINELKQTLENYLLEEQRILTENEAEGLAIIIEALVSQFPTFDIYTAELAGKSRTVTCGTHGSTNGHKKNKPAFDFCRKKYGDEFKIGFGIRNNSGSLEDEINKLLQEINYKKEFTNKFFELSEIVDNKDNLNDLVHFYSRSSIIVNKMQGDGRINHIASGTTRKSNSAGHIVDANDVKEINDSLVELLDNANPEDKDEINLVFREVKQRIGQYRFRKTLLEKHDSKCAVTRCEIEHVIDAAHIEPHNGKNNNVENGVLLRTDIHRLFDRGLLTISELGEVTIEQNEVSDYDKFNGVNIFESMNLFGKEKEQIQNNLKIKLKE